MGLDFKFKDFAYPLSILRLKHQFDKNQWLNYQMLEAYQSTRLRVIIEHAYRNVPYYRHIFKEKGIIPSDIKCAADLKIIPFLTKDNLRESFSRLIALNALRYKPQLLSTSGTTGGAVQFYVDKPSNILEFVFYWRFWGWAGYKLMDNFAELSAQSFTPYTSHKEKFCYFEKITRRLMINSLLLSHENRDKYISIFKKFKPKFIKGLPSNLYMLALILNRDKNHGITLRAVFSQGENLMKYQRDIIEQVFSCQVFDYYGHMQRTMAISQCPEMTYHLHSDYGVGEFISENRIKTDDLQEDEYIAEVVGTSLYNFSMPLLRYKTGDYVKVSRKPIKCICGRGFPVISSVLGRQVDIIITPDGRAITALFVALDRTPGIAFGQIIQENLNQLVVKVAYSMANDQSLDLILEKNIRDFVGDNMKINIVHVSLTEELRGSKEKHKVIISKVKI